ncbi:aromatic prenyltransferase [Pseudomassariella vexata]|uniref:Aromatic prenyltransferase n=1 Tax=Pseudomassariella vexata TaxID=1141098 RepID=A0A1Y2DNV9_9PEZI|nr:aromatic prenyltransferase [Pseudomassariella vexata]ORY60826.1 aromatic prenyltransferase [Pseudomassariella vexata]
MRPLRIPLPLKSNGWTVPEHSSLAVDSLKSHLTLDNSRLVVLSKLFEPTSRVDCDSLEVEAPTHPTHLWWWKQSAALLETLLTNAGTYTAEEKADHMRVFRDVVIPSWGPPQPSSKVTPLLTIDGSPFEPSWNFTPGKSIVRYTFEPLGDTAGTEEDPFGGLILPSMIPSLENVSTDVDLAWFKQIMDAWMVRGEEAKLARANMPLQIDRVAQSFLAFDMKGSKRNLKAYFFPVLKHFATGQSTEKLTFDLIRSLQPCGDLFAPVVAKLENYLVNICPFSCPVEMIAIDCIDPTKARIKVYARSKSVSKATLRNGVTLGGAQMNEMTMDSLKNLEKIWHLVFDERGGMMEEQDKMPQNQKTIHHGICFVFEMRAGVEHIDVKAHVPWVNYSESDMHAAANFTSMLKLLGWDEAAANYVKGVSAVARLPGQDYSKPGGISYWSYNYGGVGSYMSCYFSPKCNSS